MKKSLFVIMLVVCFAGFALGETPILQNNIGNVSTINNLIGKNWSAYKAPLTTGESQTSPCDNPPPPPPDSQSDIFPSCTDISDEEEDNPPFGTVHKGTRLVDATQGPIARFFKWNSNTQAFEFYEENQNLDISEGGAEFKFDLPSQYNINSNYAYFRIDVLEVGTGQEIFVTRGYFGVVYPTFEIPPPF